jgi:hypothetical protein
MARDLPGLGAGDELFAFEVVGLVPEQSLTIRWKRLYALG